MCVCVGGGWGCVCVCVCRGVMRGVWVDMNVCVWVEWLGRVGCVKGMSGLGEGGNYTII